MSTIKTGTTLTTAYQVEGDTTGALVIQTGSTPTTAVTIGSNQSVTFAGAVNAPNTFGFKNRIINGAMMIDQRNAGASVASSNSGPFVTDRWSMRHNTGGGEFTGQQVAAPTGSQYTKALKLTVTTVDSSIAAGEYYVFRTKIEGFNIADFLWGTASAKTITLSFEVTSSVTGTFSVAVCNYNNSRSYVATFTVSSANTPEVKTITVPGDTSGTWYSDNGTGIDLLFNIGMGSTYTTASTNSWQAGTYYAASGQTNLIATNGATFYITGVQLEKGSTATSFDYRPIGTELALCQRYFAVASLNTGALNDAYQVAAAYSYQPVPLPVSMRTVPSLTTPSDSNFTLSNVSSQGFIPVSVNNISWWTRASSTNRFYSYPTSSTQNILASAEL